MLRQLTEGVVNPGREVGVLVKINLKDANGSFMGKLDGGATGVPEPELVFWALIRLKIVI